MFAKKHPGLKIITILNPNNGPGVSFDSNYREAIIKLQRDGILVIGYVASGYGHRDKSRVKKDISLWSDFYPEIDGIFIDEMRSDNKLSSIEFYHDIAHFIRLINKGIVVANPGVSFSADYISSNCADIFIGWENKFYPKRDINKFDRKILGALVHSQSSFDSKSAKSLSQDYYWIYIIN